jgi:hypothetical protein
MSNKAVRIDLPKLADQREKLIESMLTELEGSAPGKASSQARWIAHFISMGGNKRAPSRR